MCFFTSSGTSLITSQPIWPDITRTIGHTAQVCPACRGDRALPRGSRSASSRPCGSYSVFDYTFTSFSFLGFAMPTFWLALLLQILFVDIYLKWGRPDLLHLGSEQPRPTRTWSFDRLQHIALPVITLTIISFALYSRYMRRVDARRDQHRLCTHCPCEGPSGVAGDHAPCIPQTR